jgi:formamidopyrimidine-DNA glycosylase
VPELPEVETVVRTLAPRLCGRTIRGVQVGRKRLRRRWNARWEPRVRDASITAVQRRGKWILVDLGTSDCLLIHLGMTGRLRVVAAEEPAETHTHVVFALDQGDEELRFRDARRFGSVTLLSTQERMTFFRSQHLGPEPFDLRTTQLFAVLSNTRRCLKAVLLDQQVVAGVGNIYADEALFEARLHPARPGQSTARAEAERLRRAIIKVLERAIAKKGSTIRDYLDGDGQSGGYQREFRVYQRTGAPCSRCRTPIAQIRLAGRSTHFCPQCQPVSP